MSSMQEINSTLYNALKRMLPGLPDNVRKLTLHLEQGNPPVLQIEHALLEVDGDIKVPVEFSSDAFCLVPLGDDTSFDVTCLGDLDRRYVARDVGPLSLKADEMVKALGEWGDILRRYGARVERSEIAALTEEVRQLRKEINARLYEVAKNTKRSVEIAEHSFDIPDAVTQVKVNPVGGGPSSSPLTGHFLAEPGQ